MTGLAKLQSAAELFEKWLASGQFKPSPGEVIPTFEAIVALADYAMRMLPKGIASLPPEYKDGREIMIFSDGDWRVGWWATDAWANETEEEVVPTHWCELPPVAEVSP